jgi:hypothetical protein
VPALLHVSRSLGKPLGSLRVWDPFFCTGAVAKHFHACGVHALRHAHEDFYAVQDFAEFDLLVTNPPYSGEHKERALAFAVASGRPFLLLLPAYVAGKEWFRDAAARARAFFASPPRARPYAFAHPAGTGKRAPPFASLWVAGALPERAALVDAWRRARPHLIVTDTAEAPALAASALVAAGRRKNPRQRRAEKARREATADAPARREATADAPARREAAAAAGGVPAVAAAAAAPIKKRRF